MAASNYQNDSATSPVYAPFKAVWRMAFALLTIWFIACAIQIAYVRLNHQIALKQHFDAQILYYLEQSPSDLTTQTVLDGYEQIARFSAQKNAQISPNNTQIGRATTKFFWESFKLEIVIIFYTSLLFLAKANVALMSVSTLILLWIIAAVDGLVQRYIRTQSSGHESASIYHRAKNLNQNLLPPLALTIFFCYPIVINPMWIFFPIGLIAAITIRIQFTYYKKYL